MPTPNYAYEKRQRELAKKRKKEEKAARKAHGGRDDEPEAGAEPPEGQPGPADAPTSEPPAAG
ncbi:hypothetical protein AACH06_02100 [Ideonella sp. DXS29W]|uniref:Uncharacterized protein n=1 Tax=Ideonella lacteola TaxID=2984193 RepID=A0ABU9BLU1_9BURK